MSRRSPADVAALALLATTVGCATAGVREAVLLDPIVESSPPRGALPDESERMAGRVIALVFADRDDDATQAFQMLQGREWGLDEQPTGLVDNAEALIQSTEGHLLFEDWALGALDRGVHDPALLLQLERYLESQPLTVARARLREDRARKLGGWANRLIAPAARFVQGAGNPLAAIRAAVSSLLSIHAAPEATTQERQALRAYRDFVDRYPDTPGAVEAAKRIEHYDGKLRRQLGTDALAVAEAALEGGRPDIALMFIERAERLIPDDAADSEIRPQAEAQVALYEARIRRSLSASPEAEDPSAALVAPLLVASVEAAAKQAAASDTPSPRDDDELDFVSALPARAQGREEEFLDAMGEIAEGDPETSEKGLDQA